MDPQPPDRPDALFLRMASRPVPRVVRMMNAASEVGLTPAFCGAHREEGLPPVDSWGGFQVYRVGPYCPLLNGRRPLAYLKLIAGFNRSAYRLMADVGPRLIHASDIETLPAAVVYAKRHGIPLVYNIHDNLAQRYRLPRWVRFLLNRIEGGAILLSDCTVVPEPYRRDALPAWSHPQVHVVRNTPEDPGPSLPRLPSDEILLFYGGWIDWGRGFDTLFALLEVDADLRLRVAGEGGRELIEKLEAHPRVEYQGFVDHQHVLLETAACHFVPALYDPKRPINRFAASNKLAEAFALGRPVIANSELAIVQQLGDAACLVTAPYGDVTAFAKGIRHVWKSSETYRLAGRAARKIYERDYTSAKTRADTQTLLRQVMGIGHGDLSPRDAP